MFDILLFDIDDTSNQIKTIQLQDKNGNWQNISLPPQYKRNVARTKANNSAEPQMSENAAVYGCDCGNEKRCSLALRYTF